MKIRAVDNVAHREVELDTDAKEHPARFTIPVPLDASRELIEGLRVFRHKMKEAGYHTMIFQPQETPCYYEQYSNTAIRPSSRPA
jgi:hypothetical protein